MPRALVCLSIGLLIASCSMQQGTCLKGTEDDDDNMSTVATHPDIIWGIFLAMDAGEEGAESEFYEEAEYTNYQIVKDFLHEKKEVEKQEEAVENAKQTATEALRAPRQGKKVRRRNVYGSFTPILPMGGNSKAYKNEWQECQEKVEECERKLANVREAYARAYELLKKYAEEAYSELQKS